MSIPDEEVAQVRTATDIVALIGEHSALRQQGRRWVGLCPFHTEKTPSFSVNAQEGMYYCFGCQESGDAITFVRAMEHLDFADAVRFLADRAGVVLHETEEVTGDRKRRTELFDAMAKAVAWYHERLLSAPDAGRARDYLRSRGYDGAMVRTFLLGWAPDEWDGLSRALDVSRQALVDSGLAFVNRAGRLQDAFRGRVLFPICDPSGHPVALGGRILPGGDGRGSQPAGARPEPKYKNSQETPIYAKRRTLYALNWAKHDVVATGEVVVCEGYTDVIGFFTAGLPRAVATCGTALAEEHFKLLRNFGRRIVLAYDADQAGQSAIARVYEWERRHEVDVRVAALPQGADPADLARTDPAALAAAVADAVPFLRFRIDRVLASADLSTAEGRARAADLALAAVAEHPDPMIRDQYVMDVAGLTRNEPDLVRERLEEILLRPPEARSQGRASKDGGRAAARTDGDHRRDDEGWRSRRQPTDGRHPDDGGWDDADDRPSQPSTARRARVAVPNRPGLEALRLAVHYPDLVVDRLEEVLFADDLQRRAFVALADAEDVHRAVDAADDDEVATLLRRVAVEEPIVSANPEVDPADPVIAQLVRDAARRVLARHQAAARVGSESLESLASETGMVRGWLDQLDDPALCRAASDRLVAWLLGSNQEGR